MARILLAVDLSYQCYRASAAHPMLTCRRVFTGGLYGFLTTFAKAMRETKATDVVICQDRKPYLRSRDYPEYKQIRKGRIDEDLLANHKESMPLIIDALAVAGIAIWGIDGFESDDLIGHVATRHRGRFDHIYAQSNDSDLWQLFWIPNFSIYSKSITDLANGSTLAKQGLTADQYMLMTAITGTHNDVAGIDGVGPVTAKKAIGDPQVMRNLRSKHGALIDRNLALIKLPHPEFPRSTPLPRPVQAFDERAFIRAMSMYDIDVTNTMLAAFNQIRR